MLAALLTCIPLAWLYSVADNDNRRLTRVHVRAVGGTVPTATRGRVEARDGASRANELTSGRRKKAPDEECGASTLGESARRTGQQRGRLLVKAAIRVAPRGSLEPRPYAVRWRSGEVFCCSVDRSRVAGASLREGPLRSRPPRDISGLHSSHRCQSSVSYKTHPSGRTADWSVGEGRMTIQCMSMVTSCAAGTDLSVRARRHGASILALVLRPRLRRPSPSTCLRRRGA